VLTHSQVTRAIVWCDGIRVLWPGARAAVDIDDTWLDWRFRIKFKNGVEFSGDRHDAVFEQARDYAHGVKALTGEWP